MEESFLKLTDPDDFPDSNKVERWLGKAFTFWKQISDLIDQKYPGVFTPEWLYTGKKHGWSLRYKKNKSFCTMIPGKDQLAIQIVFGKDERSKVEEIKEKLSSRTRNAYESATTYHDGKWLLLDVDGKEIIRDIEVLLATKRKPKNSK